MRPGQIKAISSSRIPHLTEETQSIVRDFKKVLSEKYGKEVASFVFSQEDEVAALSNGLNKKMIATALKHADHLEEADFSSYQEALKMKNVVAGELLQRLKGTACYERAKKKYEEIKEEIKNFQETAAHPNLKHEKQLKQLFQESLQRVDTLARTIRIMPLLDNEQKIEKIFSNDEQSQGMLQLFLQHQEVIDKLRFSQPQLVNSPVPLTINQIDPLISKIQKAATALSSFSVHCSKENESHCLSSNQHGEVIIQEATTALNREQQKSATDAFFDALKECYGAPFINQLRSEEQQGAPVTIGEAIEILKKIDQSFKSLAAFLKKQPLFITEEYLQTLLSQPKLAAQVEHDYQQLEPHERSLLQSTQELISTTTLQSPLLTSTRELISGTNLRNLLIAEVIPKTIYAHFVVAGTISLPVALLAIATAGITGAAAGLAWSAMSGNPRNWRDAIWTSGSFTMEGTIATIANRLIENSAESIIPFSSVVTELILSRGCGLLARTAQHALIGGTVSGALTSDATASIETTPSTETAGNRRPLDLQEELSFENRLCDYVDLKEHWDVVMARFSELTGAVSGIPTIAADREVAS
jgi:hypothetical protein